MQHFLRDGCRIGKEVDFCWGILDSELIDEELGFFSDENQSGGGARTVEDPFDRTLRGRLVLCSSGKPKFCEYAYLEIINPVTLAGLNCPHEFR
jgi:hypothetical protein